MHITSNLNSVFKFYKNKMHGKTALSPPTLSPPSTCGKTHRFYSCMQQCPLISGAICAAGKESPIQFMFM